MELYLRELQVEVWWQASTEEEDVGLFCKRNTHPVCKTRPGGGSGIRALDFRTLALGELIFPCKLTANPAPCFSKAQWQTHPCNAPGCPGHSWSGTCQPRALSQTLPVPWDGSTEFLTWKTHSFSLCSQCSFLLLGMLFQSRLAPGDNFATEFSCQMSLSCWSFQFIITKFIRIFLNRAF